MRMWRPEIREGVESVGVWAQARWRALALRQEREPVVDDVVGEDSAVGVLRRFGRVEGQHVRQGAFGVDRLDGLFAGVATGVAELMDEHVDPSLPVVDRDAGVVLLFGV